jgi:hypothetical protein
MGTFSVPSSLVIYQITLFMFMSCYIIRVDTDKQQHAKRSVFYVVNQARKKYG